LTGATGPTGASGISIGVTASGVTGNGSFAGPQVAASNSMTLDSSEPGVYLIHATVTVSNIPFTVPLQATLPQHVACTLNGVDAASTASVTLAKVVTFTSGDPSCPANSVQVSSNGPTCAFPVDATITLLGYASVSTTSRSIEVQCGHDTNGAADNSANLRMTQATMEAIQVSTLVVE